MPMIPKILSKFQALPSLFFLILSACQTRRPEIPNPSSFFAQADAKHLSLFAMGTELRVSYLPSTQTELHNESLEALLKKIISDYESVFSDWNDESELRKFEKRGWLQSRPLKSSPLFFEGLNFSLETFTLTGGLFDVSMGAVIWKERSRSSGLSSLKMNSIEKSFSFGVDPVRLSFGGLAKGMLSGAIAQILYKNSVRDFWVNAGGGNEVYGGVLTHLVRQTISEPSAMSLATEAGTNEVSLYFASHSNSFQNGKQHIFDPRDTRRVIHKQVSVYCFTQKLDEATHLGAIADAVSTALVIENFKLPKTYPCVSFPKIEGDSLK